MPDEMQTFSDPASRTAAKWLTLATILVHGLSFVPRGPMWDDWILWNRLIDRDWDLLWSLMRNQGVPFFYFPHRVLLSLPDPILGYRLLFVLCAVAMALAVMRIATHAFKYSPQVAAALALGVVLFPPTLGAGFLAITTPYSLWLAAFFSGWALIFTATRQPLAQGVRVSFFALASVLLTLSFSLKSLLVFHGWMFAILVLTENQALGASLRALKLRWLLLALPTVSWVLTQVFFPAKGSQSSYNALQFKLGLSGMPTGLAIGVKTALFDALNLPLSGLLAVPFVALLVGVGAWQLARAGSASTHDESWRRPVAIGSLGLVLAIAPYAVVNKSPSFENWELRHAMLTGLPVCLLLLGIMQAWRLSPALRRTLVGVVLAAWGWWHGTNYVRTAADSLRDQWLAESLGANQLIRQSHVIWLDDKSSDTSPRRLYLTVHWGGIMYKYTGLQGKLGLDLRHYRAEDMNWELESQLFTSQYGLEGATPTGCVVRALVTDPPRRTDDAALVARALLYRLASPARLAELTKGLGTLRVEAVSGCERLDP